MSVNLPIGTKYVVYDVESVGLLGEPWAIGWVAMNSVGKEVVHGASWAYPMEVDPLASADNYAFAEPAVAALATVSIAQTPEQVLRDLWDLAVSTRDCGAALYCDVFSPVDAHALRQAFVLAVKRGKASPLIDSPRVIDINSIVQFAGIDRKIFASTDKHNPIEDARCSWERLRYMLWTHHTQLPAR